MKISRRSFLKKTSSSLAFGVAAGQGILRPIAAAAQAAAEKSEQRRQIETRSGDMLYRTLGRTKERVSVIGLGGYHIGKPQMSEADSIKIIRSAIDHGITFMDNCWDYNKGQQRDSDGEGSSGGRSPKGNCILRSKTVKPIEALHYSMTLPTSAVITGIDNLQVLDQAIEAARTFKPMTKEEIAALLGRTREAAAKGQFELYKISQHFDGTARTRSGSAKQRGCRRFAVEHTPGAADHGQIKPSVRRRALLKFFAPVGGDLALTVTGAAVSPVI